MRRHRIYSILVIMHLSRAQHGSNARKDRGRQRAPGRRLKKDERKVITPKPTRQTRKPTSLPTRRPTHKPSMPPSPPKRTEPSLPTLPRLEYVGDMSSKSFLFPLDECQADCDSDLECKYGLVCFHRRNTERVPGCSKSGTGTKEGKDYCHVPPPGSLVIQGEGGEPKKAFPLGVCEGRCKRHADCKPGLSCFTRRGDTDVPGCDGSGVDGYGYCSDQPPPSPPSIALPNSLRYSQSCRLWSPCEECAGDCYGDHEKCQGDLVCFERSGKQPVPGCESGGDGDMKGVSYCHRKITYAPGNPSVVENGVLLSEGLTARNMATYGKRVKLANGGKSKELFHESPDGGAVFADTKTGGWTDGSNAESSKHGGVGAIFFNANGEVVDYKMILKNETKRNCGGDKTWWNTWLTCEETEGGQVCEVDPWGHRPARKTVIGGEGDLYESAAYDNRNQNNPTFYITTDARDGALLKFTPDAKALEQSR